MCVCVCVCDVCVCGGSNRGHYALAPAVLEHGLQSPTLSSGPGSTGRDRGGERGLDTMAGPIKRSGNNR